MATLISDWTDQALSATEEQGLTTGVTRCMLVHGLTGSALDRPAEALAAVGVAYGDLFPDSDHLICTGRSVDVGFDSAAPTMAKVILTYSPIEREDGDFLFRFSSSVSQETTPHDSGGIPINLAHTYAGDPDYGDQTFTQGAEVDYWKPQLTAVATGILNIANPVPFLLSWIGHLNSDTWMGGAPGHWMCTRFDAEPHRLTSSPPKWKCNVEMQANPQLWAPRVTFKDQRTGVPPVSVISNVGTKRIGLYQYREFGSMFPSVG